MTPRIDYPSASPAGFKALFGLQQHVEQSGLASELLDLVKLRSSQINGCGYCIDMHWKEARARGQSEQRLYGLDAWAESPYYTDRERAALAWTEALTRIGDGHVPDAVYAQAREQFSEKTLVDLSYAIVAINGWNRMCIALRAVPGSYRHAAAAG